MGTKTVISLRIKDIISGCESRVGTGAGEGREGPGAVSFSHALISWPIL